MRGPDRCEAEGHCITCSDEGIPMEVVGDAGEPELALCRDERGSLTPVMTALVGEVAIGEVLLVHAGTALARIRVPQGESA